MTLILCTLQIKIDMMTMIIATMMNLLSGTMAIKNARPRSTNKRRVNAYCLASIKRGGIGVFPRMKQKKQKNCGHKYESIVL